MARSRPSISDQEVYIRRKRKRSNREERREEGGRVAKRNNSLILFRYLTNLRSLSLIYLDAGSWDEFNLQHATRNIYHQLERDVMGGRREGGEEGKGIPSLLPLLSISP